MKKTVTKKVKVYKWVLEDLCDGCGMKAKGDAPDVPADADVRRRPKSTRHLFTARRPCNRSG